jgi:hypothetical protein
MERMCQRLRMHKLTRIAVPLLKAEDAKPHLGRESHWKQGRSAKAVADSWFQANDVPPRVRAVLEQSIELKGAELIDAWLERCTDLGDRRGSATQTDLLAVLGVGDELAVMAVEAKVTESFGPLVSEWIGEGGEGKEDRLQRLCDLLGFDRGAVGDLRYQLFHRTAAAILEARRYRAKKAVMMVHSFCANATGLADFLAFFERMGVSGASRDQLSEAAPVRDVTLWAGWASDACPE